MTKIKTNKQSIQELYCSSEINNKVGEVNFFSALK